MEETPTDLIRTLECRAFNAWPALQTLALDGWLLRFARGHTKRANSVNALWPCATPLDARIDAAEALYRRQSLPAVFRLTPLAEPALDAALAARGYDRLDPSLVLRAPIGRLAAASPDPVELSPAAAPVWLGAFGKAAGAKPETLAVLGEMLARLVPAASFARIDGTGGAPVAFGMGVAEGSDMGIFEMLTVAAARGAGHAGRVIGALARWGQARGATHAYLQVDAANAPALSLYDRLGFAPAYGYHYRRK